MPLDITPEGFDPDDPDAPLRRLGWPDSTAPRHAPPFPLATPDYSTVAKEATLAGPGPFRDWPAPPLVMPAGLLPDGLPMASDDRVNARRIEGVAPRSEAEADACVWAYRGQQALLREELGLPFPERLPPTYAEVDTPETLAAIAELHSMERARRRLAG